MLAAECYVTSLRILTTYDLPSFVFPYAFRTRIVLCVIICILIEHAFFLSRTSHPASPLILTHNFTPAG